MSHHHIPKHSVSLKHHEQNQLPKVSVENVTTQSDYEELRKAYTFIPSSSIAANSDPSISSSVTKTDNETWQQRMVMKYHKHLYKSHVIADFSKQTTDSPNNIGLRWRVKSEVMNGKGFETCGNKHCLCYFEDNDNAYSTSACFKNDKRKKRSVEDIIRWRKNATNRRYLHNYENDNINDENELRNRKVIISNNKQEDQKDQDYDNNNIIIAQRENQRLIKVPHGLGLFDYTVHFQYEEQNQSKEELVQLKLCLRCAPKLFLGNKGGVVGALKARMKQENEDFSKNGNEREDRRSSHQLRYSSSSSNRSCSSRSTSSNDNSISEPRQRNRKKRKHTKKQSHNNAVRKPTRKKRKQGKKTSKIPKSKNQKR